MDQIETDAEELRDIERILEGDSLDDSLDDDALDDIQRVPTEDIPDMLDDLRTRSASLGQELEETSCEKSREQLRNALWEEFNEIMEACARIRATLRGRRGRWHQRQRSKLRRVSTKARRRIRLLKLIGALPE